MQSERSINACIMQTTSASVGKWKLQNFETKEQHRRISDVQQSINIYAEKCLNTGNWIKKNVTKPVYDNTNIPNYYFDISNNLNSCVYTTTCQCVSKTHHYVQTITFIKSCYFYKTRENLYI